MLSGAIIFGATRDTRFTGEIFPVWANNFMPMDIKGRGRVKDIGETIHKDGLEISEKHFAAIDADGLVLFEHNLYSIVDDLALMINHEKMLTENIDKGSSVKEILKLTRSF
jgi:regulator of RNase E activity RraA